MDRFQQLDVTNSSLGAILYSDEEVVSLQSGVGLYDGKEKTLYQSNGTVYLTSHRLIYVDDELPHKHSCHLDLRLVKQTEHYAGFLKSSPKITLTLAPSSSSSPSIPNQNPQLERLITTSQSKASSPSPSPRESLSRSRDWRINATVIDYGQPGSGLVTNWICSICGFSNSSSPTNEPCQLCGVSRDPASEVASSRPSLSSARSGGKGTSMSSLPLSPKPSILQPQPFSASSSSSASPSPSPLAPSGKEGISCPTCTFLNHHSMIKCEICDSPLAQIDPFGLVDGGGAERPASAPPPGAKSFDSGGEENALEGRVTPLRSSTPAPKPSLAPDSIKLSFRKGGDRAFYNLMKSTLKSKAWAQSQSTSSLALAFSGTAGGAGGGGSGTSGSSGGNLSSRLSSVDIDGRGAARRRVGIDGIMGAVDTSSRLQKDDMQGALKDLEALMAKAKVMVDFAEALNAKLTKQERAAAAAAAQQEPQLNGSSTAAADRQAAATLIRSSLVRLGLPAPAVTEDMARDQIEYHQELARELAHLLLGSGSTPGLMGKGKVVQKGKGNEAAPLNWVEEKDQGRGIVGLDEVWCIWNRARGVALVPPQALKAAAFYLPSMTWPRIELKTFRSGLSVLHTPRYSERAFSMRLVGYLESLEAGRDEGVQRRKRLDPDLRENAIQDEASEEEGQVDYGEGASSLDIASMEDAPILLIKEMIESIEMMIDPEQSDDSDPGGRSRPLIVRDEGGGKGTRWFINRF
ncbi:hypothetical protein IE53DRAFT_150577 [Violaceomyces palustris]|uniref:Uncharacterized protein n=1 Tax=Violaceomyces palustris TaxID=1673888 RepID=A0ACD0NU34_9BASI|nr:hypothetical protein IE53DRAFT_150577 [Violaceomyces palustris]